MKETVKSLRAYFILSGLLSAYFSVTSLAASPALLIMIFNGAALLIAIGFLYAGAVLPTLLATSTERINLLLAASMLLSLVSGTILVVLGAGLFAIVTQGVALLICGYLYANVKRLAAEARPQPAAR